MARSLYGCRTRKNCFFSVGHVKPFRGLAPLWAPKASVHPRVWKKAVLVAGLLAASVGVARAQNLDLQIFRPSVDSKGYITVNASQVLGHKEVSFGLVTNWGRNVLSLEAP